VKVDVFVETPRGSRNKYEWDHRHGTMRLDRRVPGAVAFPADYGFVPETLASDGDPLDALVLLDEPSYPGIVVCARPIGVCWVDAPKYREPKLICAPLDDPTYASARDIRDLPTALLEEIQQFFDVYKDLDDGHDARADGFDGHQVARDVVHHARRRAQKRAS